MLQAATWRNSLVDARAGSDLETGHRDQRYWLTPRARTLLGSVGTAGGRGLSLRDAACWSVEIGADVLGSAAGRTATTPTEALVTYIHARGGEATLPEEPTAEGGPLGSGATTLPERIMHEVFHLAQRMHRSPAEVLEWAAVISAVVLSDPAATRASNPKDALAAFVLQSYARAHGWRA